MGLAPYGEPKYVDLILDKLIDLKEDGSFRMDMSYFNYCQGLTMTCGKFDRPVRRSAAQAGIADLTQREMDLAASIQKVTEEIMLRMARHVHQRTGHEESLPGRRRGPELRGQWPDPAGRARSRISGSSRRPAMPAAPWAWPCSSGINCWTTARDTDGSGQQHGSFLGPAFDERRDPRVPGRRRSRLPGISRTRTSSVQQVADQMATEKVVGWLQGRMEFGPRALGTAASWAMPAAAKMQSVMNLKIKFRESFRPFAPSVLRERVARILRDAGA